MRTPLRRLAVLLTSGALIGLLSLTASAQSPGRTIRLVVALAPGGPADVIARKIAERLGPQLNAVVVVDSKPGANGVIGV